MNRTIPALQRQQRWLSQAWAGYETAVAEGREPNEDSLKQLLARDRLFEMAMASAVRAGLDGCINAPGDCSEAFVSCHSCAGKGSNSHSNEQGALPLPSDSLKARYGGTG